MKKIKITSGGGLTHTVVFDFNKLLCFRKGASIAVDGWIVATTF